LQLIVVESVINDFNQRNVHEPKSTKIRFWDQCYDFKNIFFPKNYQNLAFLHKSLLVYAKMDDKSRF
jgi:hypothetical protein